MNVRFSYAAAWIACCLLLALSSQSSGQNAMLPSLASHDGITVYGTGEISRPDEVEIDLHVTGKAELTGDAIVKFRDAKKRALDALEKLKLNGLSTEELGLTIAAASPADLMQRINNGLPPTPSKTQIEVSSMLRVHLTDVRQQPPDELIKTVGKLLDVAQDSGVTLGPSQAELVRNARFGNYASATSPVRFLVNDLADMREKAYERAVADARNRAMRLAKLSQVKLGNALSVQEIQVAGDPPIANANNININLYGQASTQATTEENGGKPRISSSALSGMQVQVKLLVRFAIVPSDPATAQQ